MSAHANVASVIIKRKKVVGGGGHHGGAWKVAYADFVTAMMAFFMLMWLLNATTEQQRSGIADYFSPTIPIHRISGGGEGAFGGESIFSEDTLPRNGTGAAANRATQENRARGATGSDSDSDDAAQDKAFESLDAMLQGFGGESRVMENALEHINTRITDEGLVIEVFSLDSRPIFEPGTDQPTPLLRDLALLISEITKTVTNDIAVEGHVRAQPLVLAENPVWPLSHKRATQMRVLMEGLGISAQRMQRVTGHADRDPIARNPMALRNDRLEVVLLRNDT